MLSRLGSTDGVNPEPVDWSLKSGAPTDFWTEHEQKIGEFLERNKIKPVSRDSPGVSEAIKAINPEDAPEHLSDLIDAISEIFGGMKVPHFHFKGKLYLVKQEQWREFSGEIVKELSDKLTKAEQVGVEELLGISNVVNEITGLSVGDVPTS